MSFWKAAIALNLEVTPQLGDPAVRVVVVAYYTKAPFCHGRQARGSNVIGRLRKDAVGQDDPEPQPPSRRGRKPPHGHKWTVASLRTTRTPTRELLTLYDKLP